MCVPRFGSVTLKGLNIYALDFIFYLYLTIFDSSTYMIKQLDFFFETPKNH